LSSSTVLVRDTVIGGSNGTSLVNFSAGTKDICCDIEASKQIINPLTTRGDILVRDASLPARLALGANFKILQSNGTDPVWGDNPVPLTSGTISGTPTTLDLVLTSYTAFSALRFIGRCLVPTTDGSQLGLRFSTDGGSTYISTASYQHSVYSWTTGADVSGRGTNVSAINLHGTNASSSVGNQAAEGCDVDFWLYDQASTAHYTRSNWHMTSHNNAATPQLVHTMGGGAYQVVQDTDAIRFLWAGGSTWASGNWKLYGYP